MISEFINYGERDTPLPPELTPEQIKEQEEADRIDREERDAWNRRLLAGEFDFKEQEPPKGF